MTEISSPIKVFCIGFQKTGTSSLTEALGILGYNAIGYSPFRGLAEDPSVTKEKIWNLALPLARQYDVVQDTPWPILFRELDQAFPEAKFIHVVRDEKAWIRSAVKDFSKHHNEIHRLIYGSGNPVGNEESWVETYRKHNRDVEDYFVKFPGKCLHMKMESPDYGWKTLCNFLGKDFPEVRWPHVNRQGQKEKLSFWGRNTNRVKRMIGLG